MELSPLEIRSQKFSKKIKGYDVTEVDSFLEMVSKDMEKLYGEYYGLKEELVKKNQEISDYKEKDKSISEAILMVQSVSNDIKKAAIMEAESIKKAAETEADNMIRDAKKRYLEITNDINDLLNKRILIINSVKSLLQTNIDLINREAEKNFQISFPSERIKIEEPNSANEKINGKKESNTEYSGANNNYDLADFLKEGAKAPESQNNTQNQDIEENNDKTNFKKEEIDKDEGKGQKDMEELLGDINKFTF